MNVGAITETGRTYAPTNRVHGPVSELVSASPSQSSCEPEANHEDRSDGAHPFARTQSHQTLDMHFRVDLDIFRGPLDLLLYLVRKHELDVAHVAIAKIANQFFEHLEVLQQLDINLVGDFIEIASILIEIKSKMALPHAEEEQEDAIAESHEDLVQHLLDYKKYKDASSILEDRRRDWQLRFTRLSNDLQPREIAPADQPLREVEIWDLVSALGRVLKTHEKLQPTSIVLDETPISVFMKRIHSRLCEEGQVAFSDMFEPGMRKANLIGVFLAVLELVRHHRVRADQSDDHGEIYLLASEDFSDELSIDEADDYSGIPLGREINDDEDMSNLTTEKPR